MRRYLIVLFFPLLLAACVGESVWAPDELMERNVYRKPGPATLTLITMKNTGTGNGAHTAVMINASQRVLWDPAGTFAHPSIPERNDVIFGVTPRIEQFYLSYHSRVTYYTVQQTIEVSPEVAEMALRAVMAYGAVPKANCTRATAKILRELPGFEDFTVSFFPNNLHDQFAELPGVVTTEYREDDADDKSFAAAEIDAAIRAGQ
ncbi:MAG: hypothetical protein COB65_07015 [Thalassobium sp.]|uniref:hypothetical protein n=1 Tax=Octadecabacter sp. SW4 TaxID=2602067 RepID=UPI000C0D84A4|nr:hypothetical protein [Octadecabacter sp. SW4]PHQ83378.1 MAG: hypothetical protein COB65_07015 [Thalassobium sp.]QEE36803.1 hypothetical protein FTO60_14395 [Octadecabacter sp. SW4]|tara:strand:- start:271 stop:885 length:615 start_codon:yes stop_codon:yes gene_type:complete